MNPTSASVSVQRRTPEAVFSLLSSDVRVGIVQALGEAGEPVSFSALREAVGVDDSGKFNYHLQKLVGSFVTRTDDGYSLTLAGSRVYGAILSGSYTADAVVEPFAFEGPCPMCGSDVLVAEYVDERAKLACPDCGAWRNEFSFPPATLDQFAREELPFAFDRWMRGTVGKVLQGFCTNCGGRVDGRLEATDDGSMPVRARFECERCGDRLDASAALPVLFDPTVVAFFADHGVDVFRDPSWRYFGPGVDVDVAVTGTDPVTASVAISIDGTELTATLDETVSLVNVSVESATVE